MVRWSQWWIWAMLLTYVAARVCQMYADRVPTLLMVVLHVIPPAVFAVVHGAAFYGRRAITVFAGLCLGIGVLAEEAALHTGFPFGHYYFTDMMGPKVFDLPVLLALAYLGIGYVAWVLALLILGCANRPLRGVHVVAVPLLASLIMMAWDLAMDPSWSTLYRAWVWKEGGAFFGVPLSNFYGWFLTGFCYYQAFALYCRSRKTNAVPRTFWLPTVLFYAVCALGNLLILMWPMAPSMGLDGAGTPWLTADVLQACVLVSLLVMMPIAGAAAWRARKLRPLSG
jgi:putative membrane protein